ncbi:MAG: hypothetical protein WKG07_07205 [Hymenobacter sp.]
MNEPFDDPQAAQDTVRRYERMLAADEAVFFDLEEFEVIIDHYVTIGRVSRRPSRPARRP